MFIAVDIYRVTLARPVDAFIRSAARGVRIRMYLEPNEYINTARPGNKVQMDRLVAAAKQYQIDDVLAAGVSFKDTGSA